MSRLTAQLPYDTPPLQPRRQWLRPAAYILVFAIVLWIPIQFQIGLTKAERRAARAEAAGVEEHVKGHKGAIPRWQTEFRQFWQIRAAHARGEPPPPWTWNARHPNMPITVILLSPFAYLPMQIMAIVLNTMKLLVLAGIVLMTVAVTNHQQRRMPDWLVFLGVVAALDFFLSDIQHGNTNMFVAGAVVGHLYLYRRGHDLWAGALLALGICLKVTPLLFVLYWLYQRQWRVLASVAVVLPALVLLPLPILGWDFYVITMGGWIENLLLAGVEGRPYPMHINQSLPAMIDRYFTSGDSGNYLWDPDRTLEPVEFAWITVVDLGRQNARLILMGIQAAMVVAAAWVIGWRVLPREDGRRGLHYGIVVMMMLLLNQRTWDHHAVYIVVAHMALIYAIARGNHTPAWRHVTGAILLLSVAMSIFKSGDILKTFFGEDGAERVAAYGTSFWHYLVVWLLCIALAARLRNLREPYREVDRASPADPAALPAAALPRG
jgi:hypothetical protein